MQENYNEFQTNAIRKKKKTGVVIGAVAAVLVGGSGVAYAAVPAVQNTVNMTVMKPDKYCVKVYEECFDKMYKEAASTEGSANEINFKKLTVDVPELADLLAAELGYDVFNSLSLEVDTAISAKKLSASDLYQTTAVIKADDREVVKLDVIVDVKNKMLYMNIPGLTDKICSIDLSEEIPDGTDELIDGSFELPDLSSEALLKKYTDILVEYMGEGESELEKSYEGSVCEVNYKYNRIETRLDGVDFSNLFIKLAETIENDENIKKLVENPIFESEISMSDISEDLRSNADSIKEEDGELIVYTYVDPEGVIRGIELGYTEETGSEDVTSVISTIIAKEGNDIAFECSFDEVFSIELIAKVKDDKYTGDVSFTDEDGSFVVNFEDFEIVDKKFINGVISMDMSELGVEGVESLALSLETDGKVQKVSSNVSGVTVSAEYTYGYETKEIAVPQDSVDYMEYAELLDEDTINSFVEEIGKNIGFENDDLTSIVESFMSLSSMNSYDEDYDMEWSDEDYDMEFDTEWSDEDYDMEFDTEWSDEDFDSYWSDEDFEIDFDDEWLELE